MKIIGIYKITSPSDKVYIGQSIDVVKRFKDYSSLRNCKKQRYLYHSFKKYGVDNHNFEIIKECCVDDLNYWERYYQDYYEEIGYCMLNISKTETDAKKRVNSEETNQKISESLKGMFSKEKHPMYGKHHSEETKNKISLKNSGENNFMYGRQHSEETRKIMSKNRKDKGKGESNGMYGKCGDSSKNYNSGKIIQRLDYETENVIDEGYISYFKELGFRNSNIYACCNGKNNHHKGYKWKYKNEDIKRLEDKKEKIIILQIDKNENVIENDIKYFKMLEFKPSEIYKCCKGKSNTYKGYKWKYKNKENGNFKSKRKIIQQIDKKTNKLIKEGYVQDFIKEGFNYGNICSCCNGRLKHYKGYIWKSYKHFN